jgi:hypothetical protein
MLSSGTRNSVFREVTDVSEEFIAAFIRTEECVKQETSKKQSVSEIEAALLHSY